MNSIEKPTVLADQSLAKELLAAGKALGQPIVARHDFQQLLVIPEGYTVSGVPFAEPAPVLPYIEQGVQLNDTESFVAYTKRYQTINTLLFATLPQNPDGSGAEFRAVFDYHKGGKGNTPEAGNPSARCAHQAVYPCPLSESWKNWTRQNGKGLTQSEFVNFVEANAQDIVSPDTATVMEMAINFESTTEVKFLSKMDRLTGKRKLHYSEEVKDAKTMGALTVPDSLKLNVSVFDGGLKFEVSVRLEWRPLSDGKLTITPHILRKPEVIRAALSVVREEIGTDTGIVPLTGKLA